MVLPLYFIWHLIFGICVTALLFTYVIYPAVASLLAKGRQKNNIIYSDDNDKWPSVSVLMSVYNEEKHIVEKMKSLLSQDYPGDIHIYIGSDCSDDNSNNLLTEYANDHSNIHFCPYEDRRGKSSVINDLHQLISINKNLSSNHIYVLTDANVILSTDVIYQLVKHFKNSDIGLVDANMQYTGMSEIGISEAENTYLSSEVRLKNNESIVWKKMIGPFGGCYAIRAELFDFVPSNFLVDDFFLAMKVFDKDMLAINELSAICYEPVTHKLSQEYKRKKRISAGNFQNLFHFLRLFNPFRLLGILLISHKLLRWLGPVFIIGILGTSLYLSLSGLLFYKLICYLLIVWFLLIPIFDYIFSALGWHIKLLRSISYFNLMNVALLAGFFKFITGVKVGIWERTERI